MTAETRIVAKLSDIVLVRLECRNCRSAFSWPPSEWKRIPYTCQNCDRPWVIHGSTDEAFIHNLKDSIVKLAKAETGLPFELVFEFKRQEL